MSVSSTQSFTVNLTTLNTFGLLSNDILERIVTIPLQYLKLQLLQAMNLSVLGLFNTLQIDLVAGRCIY
jgi:hypothetical protein